MKVKFTPTETKNKIFIKIQENYNTRKEEIKTKLDSIKPENWFKIIEESHLTNWKTTTNIFVVVKNQKAFEEQLENLIAQLIKIIKSKNANDDKIPYSERQKDKAVVTLLSDQKARAIGRSGLNIRLASMLTKCDIELNEIEGVTTSSEEKSKDTSSLEALFS